jgi:D-beta-D-heptose 7-phosphate kinase/D-beta-D-heptose 1-phosphate adenosyltransferase
LHVNEYIHGVMENFAKETPIPLVDVQEIKMQPAAAGHVAVLLQELGLTTACISVVGDDSKGKSMREFLKAKGIDINGIIVDQNLQTSSHTRICVSGRNTPRHEVLRLIASTPVPHSTNMRSKISNVLYRKIQDANVVIVVDREGSIIDEMLIQDIKRFSKETGALLVGTSERQIGLFSDFDVITTNISDSAQSVGYASTQNEHIETMGRKLLAHTGCRTLFISRGIQGITVFQSSGKISCHRIQIQNAHDLSGVDETIVAIVAASLIGGATSDQGAALANIATSGAATQPGMAIVTKDEIIAALRSQEAQFSVNKLVSLETVKQIIQDAQKTNKRVIWTNGCFDILHVGHIIYLEKAKALGDILVIGINSDDSVRLFKGPPRPFVEEQQRARVLSALACVDYVTIFDEETPMKCLETLRPNIFAKGGDYTIDSMNQDERRLLESFGCEIVFLPGKEGMSTTELIERIVAAK